MLFVIINSILYITLFLKILYNNKKLTPALLVVGLWMLVSITCVLYYPTDEFFIGQLSLWPFLYLFVTFLLFSRYYLNDSRVLSCMSEFVNKKSNIMNFFCYIYLVCVIINVISDGLNFSQLAFSTLVYNASDAYQSHFDSVKDYDNVLMRFTHVYEYYFFYIVLIVAFNSLCQGRICFSIILISTVFAKRLLDSAMDGERTFIFVNVMLLAMLYCLYYRFLSNKVKRFFIVFAVIIAIFISSYFLAVSISRFDSMHMGTGGSFLHYLGSSMLFFNHGLSDSLKDTFGGVATFGGVFERLGIEPSLDLYIIHASDFFLGTKIGSSFVTFIGTLCMDFGFVITIFIAILWPPLINKLVFINGKLSYPGLFLYLFYFSRLARGVFTNGFNIAIMYYQAFIFYILLWVIIIITKNIKKKFC